MEVRGHLSHPDEKGTLLYPKVYVIVHRRGRGERGEIKER
ncbi:MAG: hypothetical protein JETT_1373 [Candidatus Jettenia ecosi]|uniref:Uncharacterized protein n=1 Tax=Candidatus Jettenia ecosi TaxID=2494326 RepID=A0A533QI29_9BACT|nr:MAG: hypothetical protein JETT_1373 [Candidatus Jettenia ecosi]